MSDLLSLDLFAGRLENAHLLAIGEQLDAHAIGLAGCGVENRHVGLMDRHRLIDHTAGGALHGVGLDVLLDDVDAIHHEVCIIDTLRHSAALALVAAGQHDDLVAFTNLVHGNTFCLWLLCLEHFGRQRHDLHEALGTQFTRNGAEDAGADRLQLGVQQDGGIAVELDQRTVLTAHALGSANHHGAVDLALFDASARSSFFDADLDDVTDMRIATLGPTKHLDAHDGFSASVIRDVESRLHLNHVCPQLVPNHPPQQHGKVIKQSWARSRSSFALRSRRPV